MPNYNVMGVAKAALEASVRYLAADFGPQGIRVNAISAGPVRTLAGAGIADARLMFNFQQRHAPLRRTVTLDEIGGAALYLLSDLSTGVTGDIHYVDAGYNIVAMPQPDALKTLRRGGNRRRAGRQGRRAVAATASPLRSCVGAPLWAPREGGVGRPHGAPLPAVDQAALRRDSTRSKRSAFITLVQAATKSFTNFSFESEHA